MTDDKQSTDGVPEAGFLTPAFIVKRDDGVFVVTELLNLPDDFIRFVDRLYNAGERFAEADFELLNKLSYDSEAFDFIKQSLQEVRIAANIVHFTEIRAKLYRPFKILDAGKRVEYLFEPVTLEVSRQEPVYGEPDDQGVAPIVEYVEKIEDVPTTLDFDEFCAAMWLKGVRFGLDEAAIRESILDKTGVRRTVARQLDPTVGRDAEITETSPDLHRDNSPKILANGMADLGQFKNRFPQMTMGTKLLKKVPRVPGKQGRTVAGVPIEPKLPKDLDLFKLTSAGTNIEVVDGAEYIVATMNGFLTLDPKSNKISVSEIIENKGGISVKTTGDLVLSVDQFIEHGEVQEGRVVKGHSMTFMSDVYGRVISDGGNLHLKKHLTGGVAETLSGDIELSGHVSRSLARSGDGDVVVKFSESSTLIGKTVRVEHAVNCEIVADEIEAGVLEGCTIVAKKIHIVTSDERRGNENLVTMLIPDMGEADKLVNKLKSDIAVANTSIGDKTRELDMLKSDADFAKFLVLAERVKSGTVKITSEQAVNWRKLIDKHAKPYAQATKLIAELAALHAIIHLAEESLVVAQLDRVLACEGVTCVIDRVKGQTSVQTMRSHDGVKGMAAMQPSQIRETLKCMDVGKDKIFSDDTGKFEWQYSATSSEHQTEVKAK